MSENANGFTSLAVLLSKKIMEGVMEEHEYLR